MSVDVVCPDCGGIIGGTGSGGRPACSCTPGVSKSDTVRIEIPLNDVNEATQEKLCIVCGKNVAGHRRVKDSRGYMCYNCAKAEMDAEKAGTVRCAECGKRVKPAGLVDYDGIRICRKCHNDHKEIKKKAVRKVATRHYELAEKKTVFIIAGILFVLLVFMLVGYFKSH